MANLSIKKKFLSSPHRNVDIPNLPNWMRIISYCFNPHIKKPSFGLQKAVEMLIWISSEFPPSEIPGEPLEMIGSKMNNLETLTVCFSRKSEDFDFFVPLLKGFQSSHNLRELVLQVMDNGPRDDYPQILR